VLTPSDDTSSALSFASDLVVRCAKEAAERQAGVSEGTKEAQPSLAGSVVTEVDLAVERLIDDALAEHFPDDGILGEEFADRPSRSGRTWVVDPVDGTLNYARRLGPWAVVLSAWQGDVCDLVAIWSSGSLYTAARGRGAQRDGEELRMPERDVEAGGIVLTPAALARPAQLAGWLARIVSSSASEICQIADGRVTGTVRLGGHPRDLHGPALLVEEAGGRVSDLDGGAWSGASTGLVIARAGAHARLLELAAAHRTPPG
jgi:myo-inositol-1(or 4)-monophosphatase